MMVNQSVLNKLREFGLNTYEAKLWAALLSRGTSTAGELSDIANVPRSRSYDVLESLEKKGFIIMKLDKPIKYIAVPPEEVLERVKKRIEANSQKQIKLINELKTEGIITELNTLHTQGVELIEPSDLSGSLKGQDNIYNHLETMIKNAKKSVTIITTSSGLMKKLPLIKSALKKAKSKPKIRIAAPIGKEHIQEVKEFSKIIEIKHTNKKARFCVIDEKEVIFMLLDDEKAHPSYDTAIWANTEFFAKTLETIFNSEWKKLKSVD